MREALGATPDDEGYERMLRTACAFALRRHRVDLLEGHREAIARLPVGVERDAVLATFKLGEGDLAGAVAMVMAAGRGGSGEAGGSGEPGGLGGLSSWSWSWSSSSLRAAALVHVGLGALAAGDWARAEQCARAAAAIVEPSASVTGDGAPDDESIPFDLLGIAAIVEAHTDVADSAYRELDAALSPLRVRNRLSSAHAFALLALGDVQVLRGELAAAAVNITRGGRLITADRPGLATHAAVALAFVRVRQGRWSDAAAGIERLAPAGATIEHAWIRTQVLAVRGLVQMLQGDVAGGAVLLAESEAGAAATPSYIASIVRLHGRIIVAIAAGDWRGLERHLDDAEEPGYRHPYRMGEWNALKLLAAWHLRHLAQFRRRLSEWSLNPAAVDDPYYWAFGAILAEHQGRFGDGLVAIRRAIGAIDADLDPLGRAWVRIVAGTYLGRYGKDGEPDPVEALASYDEASNELREIGATAFVARCEALSNALVDDLEMARRTEPASVLSPQQLRIATAVAHGYTSDEIAAMEHLSKRTIDYHVANIMRRLGITARREIARLLAVHPDPPAR